MLITSYVPSALKAFWKIIFSVKRCFEKHLLRSFQSSVNVNTGIMAFTETKLCTLGLPSEWTSDSSNNQHDQINTMYYCAAIRTSSFEVETVWVFLTRMLYFYDLWKTNLFEALSQTSIRLSFLPWAKFLEFMGLWPWRYLVTAFYLQRGNYKVFFYFRRQLLRVRCPTLSEVSTSTLNHTQPWT